MAATDRLGDYKTLILDALSNAAPPESNKDPVAEKTREVFAKVAEVAQSMPSEEDIFILLTNLKNAISVLVPDDYLTPSKEEEDRKNGAKLCLIHARAAFGLRDYLRSVALADEGLKFAPEKSQTRANLYLTKAQSLAARDSYTDAQKAIGAGLREAFEKEGRMKLLGARAIFFINQRDKLSHTREREKARALVAIEEAILIALEIKDDSQKHLEGLRDSITDENEWEFLEAGDASQSADEPPPSTVAGQVFSYAGQALELVGTTVEDNKLLFEGFKLILKLL